MRAIPRFLKNEEGQAVVEYVLALSLAMLLVTVMATGLRKSLLKLWEGYTKSIAAPCPGCQADPKIHFR